MRIDDLTRELALARAKYGNAQVTVSVDLDTLDSEGLRCFGDIIEWTPGSSDEIVLIAENGTLNFGRILVN